MNFKKLSILGAGLTGAAIAYYLYFRRTEVEDEIKEVEQKKTLKDFNELLEPESIFTVLHFLSTFSSLEDRIF